MIYGFNSPSYPIIVKSVVKYALLTMLFLSNYNNQSVFEGLKLIVYVILVVHYDAGSDEGHSNARVA